MVKQKVKIFTTNVTSPRAQSIEDQINEYLKTADDEKITSVSYMTAGVLEKALVVLDIYEPREQKEKKETIQQEKPIRSDYAPITTANNEKKQKRQNTAGKPIATDF